MFANGMTLEFLQDTVTLASMELPEFNTLGFYKDIDVMLRGSKNKT